MSFARFLLLGSAMTVLMTAGALAADPYIPPVDPAIDYASPSYFEGLYWGLSAGGVVNQPNNLHAGVDYLGDWHDNKFTMGGMAGYNFTVAENVLVGVEVQGGYIFNLSGQDGFEVFALGRLGYELFDSVLLYAAGGVGHYNGTGVFAIGGGAEWGLSDGLALRYEMFGVGELGENNIPGAVQGVDGISAIKFSFGALWHLN